MPDIFEPWTVNWRERGVCAKRLSFGQGKAQTNPNWGRTGEQRCENQQCTPYSSELQRFFPASRLSRSTLVKILVQSRRLTGRA